ncbi:MAG: hypothetical protein HYY09_06290, partial [Firmicutes bacterium]|nr:hypothetical protein [Bacillota bacterium]
MNSGLSTRKWRPFDPSRSAVIVIDCQKEWLDPKGSLFAPSTPVVVPHI